MSSLPFFCQQMYKRLLSNFFYCAFPCLSSYCNDMRHVFLMLAFFTLLFSTQPIWQATCEQLPVECGTSICEAQTESCTAKTDCQPEDMPENDCCPPFQCCMICFPGFFTPYALELKECFEQKTKPQAHIDVLSSEYVSDFFHPPELPTNLR